MKRTSRITTGIVAITLFAATSSLSASTIPARWTPLQASQKVRGTCIGVGRPAAGRFVAFRCRNAAGVGWWAKVRPDGRVLCWSRTSLAAIPPTCMVVPGHG